ncbi:MAG: S-layer homology domain-containing protein, partial [Leptolyngbyaceae cyanobacterium SM1_3_5]|nr:S-layer homology domain-containing protein [Leptolyngbyaceae cyanobacterium SM1_3_5]
MILSRYASAFGVTMLTLGLAAGAIAPYIVPISAPAFATTPTNTSFPDTQNYWAQPFIQNLAERDIVTGYPDNTYRPEQPVDRDEYAAIIRQAFPQDPERQIASGSVYKDVPQGYWASSAIEEAYEMGFMKGYPGGEFRPNQPITKVEVLVSLAQNLNLPPTTAADDKPVAAAAATTTPQQAAIAPSRSPAPQQSAPRQRARRQLLFPLAMTSLMQPLMTAPARATAANPPASNTASPAANPAAAQRPASLAVSDYYQDADRIPQYAVDDVAETTAAGIVVNYPDRRILNPTRPATRGEVAALIHQSLVHQGKISPLPSDEAAANYN